MKKTLDKEKHILRFDSKKNGTCRNVIVTVPYISSADTIQHILDMSCFKYSADATMVLVSKQYFSS